MTETQIQFHKFETVEPNHFEQIATIEIKGEIWFIAKEVCKALEIKNSRDAISRLDNDEKLVSVLPTSGQRRAVNLVNESGLYALIFKSRKKSAQKFRKWVTKEVIPSIRKKGYYGKIDRADVPNFYIRYKENLHKIDRNYFSVISELFITLNAELEKVGYEIPNKGKNGKQIMPDISVGRMFATYLKNINSEFNGKHKFYKHSFSDDRKDVDARMYPIEALVLFRRFVFDEWMSKKAKKYFKVRDPLALEYLPKMLESSN